MGQVILLSLVPSLDLYQLGQARSVNRVGCPVRGEGTVVGGTAHSKGSRDGIQRGHNTCVRPLLSCRHQSLHLAPWLMGEGWMLGTKVSLASSASQTLPSELDSRHKKVAIV